MKKVQFMNANKTEQFSSRAGLGFPIARATSSKNKATYIPYSNDALRYSTFNNYPQLLARLAYSAPTHGGAVERKSFMTKGFGFDYSLVNRNVQKVLNNMNDCGESINDLLEKVALDYSMFDGFALKVMWGLDGCIKDVKHVPFTDVRCGTPLNSDKISHYIVSNNWDNTMTATREITNVYPTFNPKVFEVMEQDENGFAIPSDMQKENAEQIIYYFKYKPFVTNGMRFYPIPAYISAIDQIINEEQIGISNHSKLYNGVGSKTIVTFPFIPSSDEEKTQIEANFKENFQNPDNDGSVIITYAQSKEELPQVNNLEPLPTDTHKEVASQTIQSIITAHNIPAILLEYSFGGGFNNRGAEMEAAINIYQQTVIKQRQEEICKVFEKVLSYMGYADVDLQIKPFSLTLSSTMDGTTSLDNNTL